jgi:inorganic pyrophosphatase
MIVVIETPKWSFTKYRHIGGGFEKDLFSPLPSLFNYGYIEGTLASDGMPEDAIVLGGRISQGTRADVKRLGDVKFIDDGKKDDKAITSAGKAVSPIDRMMIHVFFISYMVFKTIYYLSKEHRVARCRYLGFSLLQGR